MRDLRAAVQFNHTGGLDANWDTVHAFVKRAAEQDSGGCGAGGRSSAPLATRTGEELDPREARFKRE